ncbi:hypothetical protein B0H13DRAFT_2363287 [Mycena leptocephala]|nr:hypothetical protein B0H13DRAFT_2363287 [Mycena leptocephala]
MSSMILAAVILGLSLGLASRLNLVDVDDRIPFTGSITGQEISLVAEFLKVDSDARTVTVDCYPLAFNCSSPEIVVNIFLDPNLLGETLGDPPSTDPPPVPTFQLNITQGCHPTAQTSFPTFRTVSKLTGSSVRTSSSRSLQSYPFDRYFVEISLFATLASTNASVGMFIEKSFGIPINFIVYLDRQASSSSEDGVLLSFNIKRSGAVKILVVVIAIANWLVTIAFLFITVASFVYKHDIVTEMFVLPIAALFSFTSVRSNLPGAPAGFGATVGA